MTTGSHLKNLVRETMFANQREKAGQFYTVPSSSSYPYQWLWDSCWHALIYCHLGEPRLAEKELDSLLAAQWPNGMVPHIHYWEPNPDFLNINWGVPSTSSLIQPPLIAYSAWRVYQISGNKQWLKDLYPSLVRWHDYLTRERQLPGRHLYGIINPDESGEDNSPRFDALLGLPPQHLVQENYQRREQLFAIHQQHSYQANRGTHNHFWVEDLPFNIFAILSLRTMSDIAAELGEPNSERFTKAAEQTATALRDHCFHAGSFWSATGPDSPLIFVNSWARFAPLMAGLYTKAEADRLLCTHLYDSQSFATPWQLPTVAANDPSYNPDEPTWGEAWQHPDWRGAIWMMSNWCVFHGLTRYGYTEAAAKLAKQSRQLIEHSGMRENYHPETGVGQGAHHFTWGGLALDMR